MKRPHLLSMNTVWIVSANRVERALMVAELDEEGFDARGFEALSDLYAAMSEEPSPTLLVVDPHELGLDDSRWEAIRSLAPRTRTLIILRTGAALLPADGTLRRPFSIGELIGRIKTEVANGA